jgi:hypothetical protein
VLWEPLWDCLWFSGWHSAAEKSLCLLPAQAFLVKFSTKHALFSIIRPLQFINDHAIIKVHFSFLLKNPEKKVHFL